MEEEGELCKFVKVWSLVFVSLSYCYAIGKIIPRGKTRLLFFLPIISLFLLLPLYLSSVILGSITAFLIAALANFKLLLYAFGKQPFSFNPSISFIQFLLLACLPIKIQHNPSQNCQNSKIQSISDYIIKCILLGLLIYLYYSNEFIHPKVVLVLFCFRIYLFLDLILALMASLARVLLNLEIEPAFNKPHLSTSLQNFWGRRWNIIVSSILRSAVYEPLLTAFAPVVSTNWAPIPAILGTFVVSAIMHELIFYYLGREKSTWEITSFFLLHGLCEAVEVAVKKIVNGRWRLPVWMSRPLTLGFVFITALWLFFPPLVQTKAEDRALEEFASVGAFLKKYGRLLMF